MSSAQAHLAELIQSAQLQREASPPRDLIFSPRHLRRKSQNEDEIDDNDIDDEDIPLSVLVQPREAHPFHRTKVFPPMPDLRFEQSYLHSIAGAKTWWRVAWITLRDQIMMPLAQGVLYNLGLLGFQHWNRNARMSGGSAGARLRRWWYRVNNWALPERVGR
ncbi:hypothetical protein GGS21DRAFT_472494 [Xylaria nigripes]|nr:hypothetical protein GGS21DRAFT_472494 [Xylaria nigripes]